MRNRYQRRSRKSIGSELIGRGRRGKFEIVAGRELEVQRPLPDHGISEKLFEPAGKTTAPLNLCSA